LGTTVIEETIDSNNLGDHNRLNNAYYSQLILYPLKNVILDASVRTDYYEKWGWNTSPAFNGSYIINKFIKLRASISKSFRIPNYTELYYDSPTNKGNASLDKEKGLSYEAGVDIYNLKKQHCINIFYEA